MKAPCNEAFACVKPDPSASGVCRKPLIEGSSCDPHADACDWKLRLLCDAGTSTCKPVTIAALGEPCKALPNGGYARCLGPNTYCDSASSTCKAAIPDGVECDPMAPEPCTTDAECVEGVCKVFDAASCR